jgi:hypothetical protein
VFSVPNGELNSFNQLEISQDLRDSRDNFSYTRWLIFISLSTVNRRSFCGPIPFCQRSPKPPTNHWGRLSLGIQQVTSLVVEAYTIPRQQINFLFPAANLALYGGGPVGR